MKKLLIASMLFLAVTAGSALASVFIPNSTSGNITVHLTGHYYAQVYVYASAYPGGPESPVNYWVDDYDFDQVITVPPGGLSCQDQGGSYDYWNQEGDVWVHYVIDGNWTTFYSYY